MSAQEIVQRHIARYSQEIKELRESVHRTWAEHGHTNTDWQDTRISQYRVLLRVLREVAREIEKEATP